MLDSILKADRQHTVQDQWATQMLAGVLAEHQVFVVSDMVKPEIITSTKMKSAKTLDEALKTARDIKGQDVKITVIPNGLAIIPTP